MDTIGLSFTTGLLAALAVSGWYLLRHGADRFHERAKLDRHIRSTVALRLNDVIHGCERTRKAISDTGIELPQVTKLIDGIDRDAHLLLRTVSTETLEGLLDDVLLLSKRAEESLLQCLREMTKLEGDVSGSA